VVLAVVRSGLIRGARGFLAGLLAIAPIDGALASDARSDDRSHAAGLSGELASERLDPVVVSAGRRPQRSFDAPASIQSVDAVQIREAGPQLSLAESLARIPGVAALERHNLAQDLQLSIRGFGARATFGIRGIRLVVDGIPATMPDGQGQAASFALAAADRIEVLRGPQALVHGHAAGGVLQAFSAEPAARPHARLDSGAGSHGIRRDSVLAGGGAGQAALVVDATRMTTDGFREHSAARREHVNGRLRVELGEGSGLMLLASSFDQPFAQDPLGLTREQMLANPRQAGSSAIAQDTGKRVAQQQMGAVFSRRIGPDLGLVLRAWSGQRAVFQTLAIPVAAQTAPTASGGVVDLDRDYAGAGLQVERALRADGMRLHLTLGLDHERQQERRLGFVNDGGTPGALRRDELNRVASTDVFALASLRLEGGWRVDAGVRAGSVLFRSDDHHVVAGNGDDSGAVRHRATSPVLGVSRAFSDRLNVYANLGRGFETPTFAEIAYRSTSGSMTGLNLGLLASRSTQAEIGAKWRLAEGHRVDAALFTIRTRDEIVVDASSGGRSTFRNAGRTLREGVEFAWTARFGGGLSARAALSWLSAGFRDAHASATGAGASSVAAGNRLPGTPDRLMFAEVVWRAPHAASALAGVHLAAELRHRGRMMADDANSDFAAPATVASVRAGWAREVEGWRWSLLARIDNLADRAHAGSLIVNESNRRFFEPAPGRQAWVGFTLGRAY
jgi:iron complex outermembrane receptor protein